MRGNLKPLVTPKPLEFGTAWHEAMAVLYEPTTWHLLKNPAQASFVYASAIQTFRDTTATQRKAYEEDKELFIEMEQDFAERLDLGIGMLENYFPWAHANDTFTSVKAEVEFEVPVIDPRTGTDLKVVSPDGSDLWSVMYQGRLDGIVQDHQSWYWILEHKAQPLDSLVLTPKGWYKMADIRVGDEVIGSNGKATSVVGVFPQGLLSAYSVTFSDGSRIECSKDHLWTVRSWEAQQWQTLALQDLDLTKFWYEIPLVSPVQYKESVPLPMSSYLLGLWLAEGSSARSVCTISSKEEQIIDLARQELPENHTLTKNSQYNFNWTLNGKPNLIRQALKTLGLWNVLSGYRFIPERYLESSAADRLALLQGLMDGDGCIWGPGYLRFDSTSVRLAHGVKDLVRSLGGIAKCIQVSDTAVGSNHWSVNFSMPSELIPFRLERKVVKVVPRKRAQRKIIEIEYIGEKPMQCIQVEASDGLYVTNDYVLTHNTTARWDDMRHLDLDEQLTSYAWALRQLGIHVRGIIYSEAHKTKPEPVAVNQQQRQGRWLSVNKQQTVTHESYLAAIRAHGDNPDLYGEFLEYLKARPNPFFRRFQQYRTEAELDEIQERIGWEALDMINPDLALYPTPGKFNCAYCSFKEPCLAYNQGGDYWFLLNELFVPNKEVDKATVEVEADEA